MLARLDDSDELPKMRRVGRIGKREGFPIMWIKKTSRRVQSSTVPQLMIMGAPLPEEFALIVGMRLISVPGRNRSTVHEVVLGRRVGVRSTRYSTGTTVLYRYQVLRRVAEEPRTSIPSSRFGSGANDCRILYAKPFSWLGNDVQLEGS